MSVSDARRLWPSRNEEGRHRVYDKWDTRFMELALHISSWSKDPSTKVGAVIADRECRVVGLGYNGFPRGVEDDDRLHNRPVKYKLIVHSEANAILNANRLVDGCTLYSTKFPCSDCTKLIIQAGIRNVVTNKPEGELVWTEDAEFGRSMMTEARVGIHHL